MARTARTAAAARAIRGDAIEQLTGGPRQLGMLEQMQRLVLVDPRDRIVRPHLRAVTVERSQLARHPLPDVHREAADRVHQKRDARDVIQMRMRDKDMVDLLEIGECQVAHAGAGIGAAHGEDLGDVNEAVFEAAHARYCSGSMSA